MDVMHIFYFLTVVLLVLNVYHYLKIRKLEMELEEVKGRNHEIIQEIKKIKSLSEFH